MRRSSLAGGITAVALVGALAVPAVAQAQESGDTTDLTAYSIQKTDAEGARLAGATLEGQSCAYFQVAGASGAQWHRHCEELDLSAVTDTGVDEETWAAAFNRAKDAWEQANPGTEPIGLGTCIAVREVAAPEGYELSTTPLVACATNTDPEHLTAATAEQLGFTGEFDGETYGPNTDGWTVTSVYYTPEGYSESFFLGFALELENTPIVPEPTPEPEPEPEPEDTVPVPGPSEPASTPVPTTPAAEQLAATGDGGLAPIAAAAAMALAAGGLLMQRRRSTR